MNLLVLLLLTTNGVMRANVDWPQWGGPSRDFVVPGFRWENRSDFSAIREKWRVPVGPGNSGICVRDGVAYTMYYQGAREHVIAVSLATGQTLWNRAFDVRPEAFMDLEFGPGPHSTPLVAGDQLFCIGLTGRLVALDRTSGQLVWRRELWGDGIATRLERGFAASPVAFEDSIIIPAGGPGQSIRCFAMQDGAIRWQKHDFDSACASPVVCNIHGQSQVVLLMDQELVGLDPANGNLLWDLAVPAQRYVHCTSPQTGPGNHVFVNTGNGLRGIRIDREGERFRAHLCWQSRITICQTSNFVLHQSVIYGAREGRIFAAVDSQSGKTLWQERLGGNLSLIRAGRLLFAVREDGEVLIAQVSPNAVTVLWRQPILAGRCWTGPVISDRCLLVRDQYHLIALELP